MGSFPARVWIDDQCDACGERDRLGALFGVGKPVICGHCLQIGLLIAAPYAPGWAALPPPVASGTRKDPASGG